MNEEDMLLKQELSKLTKEELEVKLFNLIKKQHNNNIVVFDITNFKLLRRLQYLNKNYTKKDTFYNAMIKEFQKTNNTHLGMFLQEHYEALEKEALLKNDLPIYNI